MGVRPLATDQFIADDRNSYGQQFTFGRENGQVSTFKTGDDQYTKLDNSEQGNTVPKEWEKYVGYYGWPHNLMRIFIRDGKLTCIVEWFYEYPLEQLDTARFRFPAYGLYESETLEFVQRDEQWEVIAASVRFKRIQIPKSELPTG